MEVKVGDVVPLDWSMTMAELCLALCVDDGAGLEIDRAVVEAVPYMVNVRITYPLGAL